MNTKKLITLLLSVVMLIGLLTGCGKTPSTPIETEKPGTQHSVLSGMIVLTAQASFNISYDQEGMVMEIIGTNEAGITIASAYDATGKSCSIAVKELIAATAEATLLREAKNVVVKLAVGSQLPSETFLTGIANDAATAVADNGGTASVVAIDLDGLDAEGYINAENAQALLKNHLGVTAFESYNGDTTPRNNCYTVYVTSGDVEGTYLIDAVTGIITESTDEEIEEPDYQEEEFDASSEETMGADTESETPEEEIPTEDPAV